MSVQVKRRRDTASNVAAYTGAQGELIVDTTNNRVTVHDGVTSGGWAAAKLSDEFTLIGVGTPPDPSNPLSVYGSSALFNGTNFNVTINKAAATDTASLIFEDGFSGRAQMGLNGSDNYSFKVSPNGSSWTTAIAVDAATGAATFANMRTAVSDANYSALITDRLIAYTALTAARVVTLPGAASYSPGQQLLIVDETGSCSATNIITACAGGMDTIDGATTALIQTPRGYLTLASNGSNAWTILGASSIVGGTIDNTVIGNVTPAQSIATARLAVATNYTTMATFTNTSAYSSSAGAGMIGTANNGTPVSAGARMGFLLFGGPAVAGSSTVNPCGIAGFALNGFSATDYSSFLSFLTTPSASTTRTEAMRLTAAGRLGIGTPSPAQALDVTGAVAINGATSVGADRTLYLGAFAVSTLPAAGNAGRTAFASNCRMFNGTGSLEAAGAGTGGLVVDNGTAWKIAGTNVTAVA